MSKDTQNILANFRASLAEPQPPSELPEVVVALWWAAKDDWDKAHNLVQGEGSKDGAWVHAYLHRVEGDLANAAYWYRRAGRQPSNAALEVEWTEIANELLERSG